MSSFLYPDELVLLCPTTPTVDRSKSSLEALHLLPDCVHGVALSVLICNKIIWWKYREKIEQKLCIGVIPLAREREISTTLEQAASHFVLLFSFILSISGLLSHHLYLSISVSLTFFCCFMDILLLFYWINTWGRCMVLILVGSPFCYAHVRRELAIWPFIKPDGLF